MRKLIVQPVGAVLLTAALIPGCSIKRMAVNKIGNALASGGSTYERDDDLQLVGDALPFGLKLIESLLAESPKHRGLLQAACQGFTTYWYLYAQQEAERVANEDMPSADKPGGFTGSKRFLPRPIRMTARWSAKRIPWSLRPGAECSPVTSLVIRFMTRQEA